MPFQQNSYYNRKTTYNDFVLYQHGLLARVRSGALKWTISVQRTAYSVHDKWLAIFFLVLIEKSESRNQNVAELICLCSRFARKKQNALSNKEKYRHLRTNNN